MTTPERCLKCEWWNFGNHKCSRVVKGRLVIGHGSGELSLETNRGLIPEYLEAEFEAWLVDAITSAVDSYPGWPEILRLRSANGGCAAEKNSQAITKYGARLNLVKPLVEPKPEKNLDAHGLFKADISLW